MADKRQMVQIESLEKYFGEEKERVHVLKGISLNIPQGSLYTFLGPSGCGKTTPLRCVAGLERPEGGMSSIGGAAGHRLGGGAHVAANQRTLRAAFPYCAPCPLRDGAGAGPLAPHRS